MRTKIFLILFVAVFTLLGCKSDKSEANKCQCYDSSGIYLKIDPNSFNSVMAAISPELDVLHSQNIELASQNKWLMKRLTACIRKLEQLQELEPMIFEIKPMLEHPDIPQEPDKPLFENEPLFNYYTPSTAEFPKNPKNINALKALLNLQALSIKLDMVNNDEKIEYLEKSLKRIDQPDK